MASILSNLKSFAHGTVPGFGAAFFAPPEIKAPTKRNMKEALAYVDALKSVSQWSVNNYNPSWLVTRKGLQIFDQMKRDEQIKAALKFKKDSVLASGWEITSPGDQEEDWEVTRFVKDSLDQMKGGWNQVLVDILSALDFGYSIGERIYTEQEIGEWKGKLVLTRVQSLKPHYVDFLSDAFGQLQGITQQGIAGAADPLPPAKFIIYSHAMEFGNFYGVSDLEAAYRPWWTKDNAYKWLAVTLERYGMAPLFALYDPNSYSGGSVEELKKVVKGMQNATMGVIPRATAESLELWSQDLNKGSSELFLKALERFDQHIARALLVPGMIGMSADEGKTGSLARSSSHQDSFMMVVTQLQNSLASGVMNAQVIPQLCDLNFPKLQSYPQFKFMQFTDEQRLEVLNTWAALVGGKIVNKIEDDETHVRKVLGFPENDDPKVIEETPPPMPGVSVGPDGQPLKLGPDGRPWKDPNAKPLFGKKPNPFEKKEFEQDDEGHEGKWVTVRGRHVFIREGELIDQALERTGQGGPTEKEIDDAGDELFDMSRDWHNDPTKETFTELVDYARTGSPAHIAAAKQTLDDKLKFDSGGKVTLYRGGIVDDKNPQSWSTDKAWAERFSRYGFGSKEKGGSKGAGQLTEAKFSKDQLLIALPWEGEVIVRAKSVSKKFEQDTGDDIPQEIPEAELSEEMRTFAVAHDAVWVVSDGQRVAVPASRVE